MSVDGAQHVVRLTVTDCLLEQAELAVQAIGARILDRTVPDFPRDTTVLHLAMPDAPADAAWIDIVLTQEQQPGEAPQRWISSLTYLDAGHREISRQDVHVTVPITPDQIPEPLRGTHRHH